MPLSQSPPPELPSRPLSRNQPSSSIATTPIPHIDTVIANANGISSANNSPSQAQMDLNRDDLLLRKFDELPVSLPTYFQELNTTTLVKLLANQDILRGYILSNPEIQNIKDDLLAKLDTQKVIIDELINFYKNELPQEIESTNVKLQKVSELMKEWKQLQVSMYTELEYFQKPQIINRMEMKLNEQDKTCSELAEKFINYQSGGSNNIVDSDHDEEIRIKKFLSDYRSIRKQYYLTKEHYFRIKEDRVGGLI